MRWLGHACFYLDLPGGVTVVTDPFVEDVPYPKIDISADLVTASHEHSDHNAVDLVKGSPQVLRGLVGDGKDWNNINEQLGAISVRTVRSYHDDTEGSERGKNAIFIFETPELSIGHLGDLGHGLDDKALDDIGYVDVLLVPVGGHYTIGPETAWEVIDDLEPAIVVPMHFKTEAIVQWPIATVDGFLEQAGNLKVRRVEQPGISLVDAEIPNTPEVWVFAPPK